MLAQGIFLPIEPSLQPSAKKYYILHLVAIVDTPVLHCKVPDREQVIFIFYLGFLYACLLFRIVLYYNHMHPCHHPLHCTGISQDHVLFLMHLMVMMPADEYFMNIHSISIVEK